MIKCLYTRGIKILGNIVGNKIIQINIKSSRSLWSRGTNTTSITHLRSGYERVHPM